MNAKIDFFGIKKGENLEISLKKLATDDTDLTDKNRFYTTKNNNSSFLQHRPACRQTGLRN